MYQKKLLYKKSISGLESPGFELNYYITEEVHLLSEESAAYGIIIEKHDASDNLEVFSATCCFMEYTSADLLLKELSRNTVTPMSADEVIDTILASQKFKY